MLWHHDMLLKESVDWHLDMDLLHEEEQPNRRLQNDKSQRPHTSQNPKGTFNGEFVVVQ